MSAEHVRLDQASESPSPLLRLRCEKCGYGVSVRKTPEQCPMCNGSVWLMEGWRPWGDLARESDTGADMPLTRDKDSEAFRGAPLT